MEVIGYKSKKAMILYIFGAILCLALAILGFWLRGYDRGGELLVGVVGFVVCIVVIIIIAITPEELISVDAREENVYLYNEKIVIPVEDIKDVSYRQARIRVVRYLSWGRVIIKTNEKKIVVNYVEDCEEVAKYLLKILYKNE